MQGLERRMVEVGTWLLSLVCGSMGIFTLWFSFLNASLSQYAVEFLGAAFALELANHFFLSPRRH
jgi:hypothetical protein